MSLTRKEQMMRLIDADKLYTYTTNQVGGVDCYVLLDEEIAPTIKTKQIKYFDEDENVWKTGSVIVDE